jgi:hypothetical protein
MASRGIRQHRWPTLIFLPVRPPLRGITTENQTGNGKTGRCQPSDAGAIRPQLNFDHQFDSDVFGRNCDRAVQRSTALEQIEQVSALLLAYTLHAETKAYGAEE